MMSDLAERIDRLARLVQNEAHAQALKPVQWEALRYLARANPVSRSPKGVTAYLGLTKGTVSQTLITLERKGLLTRHERDGDARGIQLDLTSEGQALLRQDPLNGLDEALDALDPAEYDAASHVLSKLLDQMIKRRGGTPFGVCRSCRHFKEGATAFCGLLDLPISKSDTARICMEHEPAAGAVL